MSFWKIASYHSWLVAEVKQVVLYGEGEIWLLVEVCFRLERDGGSGDPEGEEVAGDADVVASDSDGGVGSRVGCLLAHVRTMISKNKNKIWI